MYQFQGCSLMLQSFQRFQPFLGQARYAGIVYGFQMFFRGILHKDIKEIAIHICVDKMSIVFNPSNGTVLSYDTVFHVVQITAAGKDLPADVLFRDL